LSIEEKRKARKDDYVKGLIWREKRERTYLTLYVYMARTEFEEIVVF
jgi:hypothetical protein